ncbi:MAG: hypothetical protein WCP17_03045 [bacterium]
MEIVDKRIKNVELIYHTLSVEPDELDRRLQHAYDILFESVFKDYQLIKNNGKNEQL